MSRCSDEKAVSFGCKYFYKIISDERSKSIKTSIDREQGYTRCLDRKGSRAHSTGSACLAVNVLRLISTNNKDLADDADE